MIRTPALIVSALLAVSAATAQEVPPFDGDAFYTIVMPHGPDGVVVQSEGYYYVCFLEEGPAAGDAPAHMLLHICDPILTTSQVERARQDGEAQSRFFEGIPEGVFEPALIGAVIDMGCIMSFADEAVDQTLTQLQDGVARRLAVNDPISSEASAVLEARMGAFFRANENLFMRDDAARIVTLREGC